MSRQNKRSDSWLRVHKAETRSVKLSHAAARAAHEAIWQRMRRVKDLAGNQIYMSVRTRGWT